MIRDKLQLKTMRVVNELIILKEEMWKLSRKRYCSEFTVMQDI